MATLGRLVCLLVGAWTCLAAGLAAQSSTGMTPLVDMSGGATYQGFLGGLYPGESSTPPAAHLAEAMVRAQEIEPRDVDGNPDPDGVIVLLCLGYSNASQEWSVFERQADLDPTRNARVLILNGGVRGQVPALIKDPEAPYWNNVSARLAGMGLSPMQVQAVWLKVTDVNTPDDFPLHAQVLRDDTVEVVQLLAATYPELRLCYVSSRTYGGWSTTSVSPEPQAYETGFSVKWLIEDQITGEPGLNYDPSSGPVLAPLLLWGPYLWADGVAPRSDGLTWQQADVEEDGLHPSPSGEQKAADMLTDFFHTDVSATPWYAGPSDLELSFVDAAHDATVSSADPDQTNGFDPTLVVQGGDTISNAYVRFPPIAASNSAVWSKLSMRTPVDGDMPGSDISSTSISGWHEGSITYNSAPPVGGLVETVIGVSRDSTFALDVRDEVSSASGIPVAFVLTTPLSQPGMVMSRQSAEPPRIVVAAPPAPPNCQTDLGFAGPGSMALSMCGGPLAPGKLNQLLLTGAPPGGLVYFFLGFQSNPTPAEGGVLVPVPVSAVKIRFADGAGQVALNVPGGNGPLTVYLQCVAPDPSQTLGYAFSNALQVEFLD